MTNDETAAVRILRKLIEYPSAPGSVRLTASPGGRHVFAVSSGAELDPDEAELVRDLLA